MTLSYSRTYDEELNARTVFARLSASAKHFRKYGVLDASGIVFLILFLHGPSLVKLPDISGVTFMAMIVPLSFLLGWAACRLLSYLGRRALMLGLRSGPTDCFGTRTVEITADGLAIHDRAVDRRYSWQLIDLAQTTPDYVFFCSGQELLVWIPSSAFNSASHRKEFTVLATKFMEQHGRNQPAHPEGE